MPPPELPILVAYPFCQSLVDDPKQFPQFRLSELCIVVEPPQYFGIYQFCYTAQWKMHPSVDIEFYQLFRFTGDILLAHGWTEAQY